MMLGRLLLKFAVFEGGPFHTNTVAGLQLAMDYSKKRNTNTNFMITDGKPSCVREKMDYYMNSKWP
jgi:uncharacterized protein with von Willebrand factor type A (vWA) domain